MPVRVDLKTDINHTSIFLDYKLSDAPMEKAVSRYQVGEWTIDPQRGLARCQGRNVHLEPKATELLNHLVSRSGEVVSRDELLDVVWPDVTVGDEVITNTIAKLRRALEGDPELPKLIETIPKRGYRISASIGKVSVATTSYWPSQWFWIVTLMVMLAMVGTVVLLMRPWISIQDKASIEHLTPPVREKPSIAVLPFTNMSGDKEQEYFSDGMTEDLITDLSKISGLLVVARNSTFAYKGQSVDIRTVAHDLGVRYVVEGSVRKTGGRVRISTQLINAESGMHLWADRYDRELKDIFVLQDEVRQKIVEALKLKLTGADKRRLAWKGTTNVAAYDIFMRGREFESLFSREGLAEALRLYGQAIEIDPNFSEAYARMANVHGVHLSLGMSDDVVRVADLAITLAERAVKLDAESPYAHWSLGQILFRHGDYSPTTFARSVKELEWAIEINPNYADAYAQLSFNYASAGRFKAAMQSIKTAMRLNPSYPFWYLTARGDVYFFIENYHAAISDFEEAVDRNPNVAFARWRLAAAYVQVGRIEDAKWETEELRSNGFNKSVDDILRTMALQRPVDIARYREGLIKAGLPER